MRSGSTCPRADGDALADWFAEKSDSGSLVEYLKTFDLTTAVMQTRRDSPASRGSSSRTSPRTA